MRIGEGPITAAEYIRQTESDPAYQEKLRQMETARERLRQRCHRDEETLVTELRSLGLQVESVYDLVNNQHGPTVRSRFVGPYREAYPTLLKHLEAPHEPNIREGIIRALIVPDLPLEARTLLLAQLNGETNRIHRACLALALRSSLGKKEAERIPAVQAALQEGMVD